MAKTRLDTIVGVGLLVITLLLLAACQSAEAASRASEEAETNSAASISLPISEDDREQVEAANVARWAAMGRHYSELASAARELGAAADQARWEAKGEHYAALAGIRPERAAAADQARWEAKGEFYQNNSRVADTELADLVIAADPADRKFHSNRAMYGGLAPAGNVDP